MSANIPDFVQNILETNTAAKSAFMKMPQSHQNEWLRYILEAKKRETQQRRAEKMISELERTNWRDGMK